MADERKGAKRQGLIVESAADYRGPRYFVRRGRKFVSYFTMYSDGKPCWTALRTRAHSWSAEESAVNACIEIEQAMKLARSKTR